MHRYPAAVKVGNWFTQHSVVPVAA